MDSKQGDDPPLALPSSLPFPLPRQDCLSAIITVFNVFVHFLAVNSFSYVFLEEKWKRQPL